MSAPGTAASYWAVHALDKPDAGAVRAALRPPHRQRLRHHEHPVRVRIGGPLLDDDGEMAGSLLVIEARSREDVERYMAGDPYVIAGLFQRMEIRAFAWGLGQPEDADG